MDVLQAISNRRSIGKVRDQEISRDVIEKIIEAGTHAPNRYLTQPWRFYVIRGKGREALSKVMEEIVLESGDDIQNEAGKKKLEKEKNKPFRAPVIIAVAAEITEGEKIIRLEELGAVYAAIENMLLAAEGLGVATYWKTGKACYHNKMKVFFGLKEKDEVLALIYIGYADMEKQPTLRRPAAELTKWVES